MSKRNKLELDWETADRITLTSLKDVLKGLEKHNRSIEKEMESGELPEYQKRNYVDNQEYIVAFKKVIEYYGG